jgi:hypothetical protein
MIVCIFVCKYFKRAVACYHLLGNRALKIGEHLRESAKHLRPMLVELVISWWT